MGDYDFEDSFVNDASEFTQAVAGEQRESLVASKKKKTRLLRSKISHHLLTLYCAVSTEKDMRAIYLQSVRSPAGGGRFKLTSERDVIGDVYSQAPRDSEQDESYEEDSFCVNTSQINQSGATTTAY